MARVTLVLSRTNFVEIRGSGGERCYTAVEAIDALVRQIGLKLPP